MYNQIEADNQLTNANKAIAIAQAEEAKALAASSGSNSGSGSNPSGGVSNAFPCDDGTDRFIAAVYMDMLGREPGQEEAKSWRSTVDFTKPDGMTQFVAGVSAANETKGNVVNTVFQQLLGRPAEGGAQTFWAVDSRRDMTIQLACCQKEFGLPTGGAGDSAWINKVYKKLIGRSAEAGGTAYWLNILYYNTNTPSSDQAKQNYASNVVAGIYDSTESHQKLVKEAYQNLLHRDAEAQGLQYWTGFMNQGMSWEGLRQAMILSSEYNVYAQTRTDICPKS